MGVLLVTDCQQCGRACYLCPGDPEFCARCKPVTYRTPAVREPELPEQDSDLCAFCGDHIGPCIDNQIDIAKRSAERARRWAILGIGLSLTSLILTWVSVAMRHHWFGL